MTPWNAQSAISGPHTTPSKKASADSVLKMESPCNLKRYKLTTFQPYKRSFKVFEEPLRTSLDIKDFLYIAKGTLMIRCLRNWNDLLCPKSYYNFTFEFAIFSPSAPISPCKWWGQIWNLKWMCVHRFEKTKLRPLLCEYSTQNGTRQGL